MNSGMTGFNPEVVTQTINEIKNSYEETVNAFFDGMQNRFVNRMSEIWACNVAVDFFNEIVKPNVDDLINGRGGDSTNSGITMVFNSVVECMNGAAMQWAADTQSNYQNQSLSVITKSLDVSGIRENMNGIRGIDLQSAPSITSQFNEILGATTTALNKAVAAVRNSGFIGGTMQDGLITSLETIRKTLKNQGSVNFFYSFSAAFFSVMTQSLCTSRYT